MFSIPDFNPLYIDLVLLGLTGIGFLIGFIKGFKKIFFNFFIKVAAFAIAFSSVLNFLKAKILDMVNIDSFLGEVYTNSTEINFLLDLLPILVVSFVLYFVIHKIFKLVIFIFKKIFGRRKRRKKLVNRLFGGFVNAITTLIIVSFLAMGTNNPIINLDDKIEETTVTSLTTSAIDSVWNIEFVDNTIGKEKLVVILIDGNILNNTSDEMLNNYGSTFDNISAIISSPTPEEYYDQYFEATADPQERQEAIEQIFTNIVSLVSITNMIDDRNDNIINSSNEIVADFFNMLDTNLTPGETVTLDAELKTTLYDVLDESSLDTTLIDNIKARVE